MAVQKDRLSTTVFADEIFVARRKYVPYLVEFPYSFDLSLMRMRSGSTD